MAHTNHTNMSLTFLQSIFCAAGIHNAHEYESYRQCVEHTNFNKLTGEQQYQIRQRYNYISFDTLEEAYNSYSGVTPIWCEHITHRPPIPQLYDDRISIQELQQLLEPVYYYNDYYNPRSVSTNHNNTSVANTDEDDEDDEEDEEAPRASHYYTAYISQWTSMLQNALAADTGNSKCSVIQARHGELQRVVNDIHTWACNDSGTANQLAQNWFTGIGAGRVLESFQNPVPLSAGPDITLQDRYDYYNYMCQTANSFVQWIANTQKQFQQDNCDSSNPCRARLLKAVTTFQTYYNELKRHTSALLLLEECKKCDAEIATIMKKRLRYEKQINRLRPTVSVDTTDEVISNASNEYNTSPDISDNEAEETEDDTDEFEWDEVAATPSTTMHRDESLVSGEPISIGCCIARPIESSTTWYCSLPGETVTLDPHNVLQCKRCHVNFHLRCLVRIIRKSSDVIDTQYRTKYVCRACKPTNGFKKKAKN